MLREKLKIKINQLKLETDRNKISYLTDALELVIV